MQQARAACFFEVSWEVCNKVGGIYTVLASKAAQLQRQYATLFFIGPYIARHAAAEFQHLPTPEKLQPVFEALRSEGIECYYGTWQIKGKPAAVLIDWVKFLQNKDGIKAYLWERFRIDSLAAGSDFDAPVVWGWAVGKFLEKVMQAWQCTDAVAQFHEWLSGAALLYVKDKRVPLAAVFTTHATVLGRTLAGADRPLYEELAHLHADEEAQASGVQAKHGLEKASAQAADVFTTVSEITALEAEHLLGRKPDALLPNGLDFERFPDLEQIPAKHQVYRERIKEFLYPYFFPYYSFDLDKTLFFYTSGRYEFRNKGIDSTIAALGRLNERLKQEKSDRTVVAFFFIPADIHVLNLGLVESKSLFEDLQDEIGHYLGTMGQRMIQAVAQGTPPDEAALFDEEFLFKMKRFILSFRKEGTPPLATHELANADDAILRGFAQAQLQNRAEDRVKVILYPIYLSSSDGLIDLGYYETIWGCHLGIFPSYYEPWGYTPLESAAYGVPAVTTDLAGFGIYAQQRLKKRDSGIFIVNRRGKSDDTAVGQLAAQLYDYAMLPKSRRVQNKIAAEHFARRLDWKELIGQYIEAHNMALERVRHGAP